MPVTIEDISRHLGISVSTVSKALNDYSDVSMETKERVLEAARALGYHPSAAARQLRRRRSEKIGFLFGFPITTISEYVSKLITGAMTATETTDYNLILYPLLENRLDQLTRICRAREVDGLLVLSRAEIDQTVAVLEQEAVPYVVVGRRVVPPEASFITPDYLTGALLVMRHLIELGHQRIAFTTRPALGITSRDRLAGYRQGLAEAGIPFDDSLVVPTTLDPRSGYQAMEQLLDLPNPPTAVFAIHDLVAAECLQAATDRGLRVPEDVAIAGFDDWNFSLTTKPPLTTIHIPLTDMGKLATETLLAHIADHSLPPVRQTLPVQLMVRQSTAGDGIKS